MLGISLTVILAAFFVIMGFGGLFTGSEVSEDMLEPVTRESGKINVLICGVDKSESLTDTIMLASYNLDTNEVNILSVPRDTRMYIGSRYQKINAAHAITQNGKKKGMNGTIEAVTRLTGMPINYYVKFTCNAFRETIDALGGVDFDVPQNMNYDDPAQDLHIHLTKGYQHLDGDKAEQFVRFRRYPMGDIDRVAAQQSFIKALAEQKINASVITKLPELYKTLQNNLETNIKVTDVAKYIGNISDLSAENIHMHSVPGHSNGTDYGASYWIADMTALAELIENTFGYPADKITIHSADGSSVSKDKKNSDTKSAKTSDTTKTTEKTKTTESPKATKAPSQQPEKTDDTKNGTDTKNTAEPKKTDEPAASEKPTEKPENTQDTQQKKGESDDANKVEKNTSDDTEE